MIRPAAEPRPRPKLVTADMAICASADREVWMPVLGYEGTYEVSNHGRIRRDRAANPRGEFLTPNPANGYPIVTLSLRGEVRTMRLHKLVLTAFCGPEPFEGAQAAHNNGNTFNCRLSNLRWATPVENQADVDRHGHRCRGEDVFGARLTEPAVREIKSRISSGLRNPPIAREYGVSISTIHLIRHNKIWKHVQ